MQTRTYRAINENTMKDLEKFNNIYIFYKILLISILLVSSKWIISYLFFDESIDLRIINDVTDSTYFPLIKAVLSTTSFMAVSISDWIDWYCFFKSTNGHNFDLGW